MSQFTPQGTGQPDRTFVQRFTVFWSTLGFTDVLVFRIGALAFLALDYYYGQRFWKFFPMMIGAVEPLPGPLAGAFQVGFSAVQILLLEQIFTLFKRIFEGISAKDWEKVAWFAFACVFLLFSFAVNVFSNFVAFRIIPSQVQRTFEDVSQQWLASPGAARWLWAGGALLIAVLGEMLWELAGQVAEDRANRSGRTARRASP
jgi:hypothetical protein